MVFYSVTVQIPRSREGVPTIRQHTVLAESAASARIKGEERVRQDLNLGSNVQVFSTVRAKAQPANMSTVIGMDKWRRPVPPRRATQAAA